MSDFITGVLADPVATALAVFTLLVLVGIVVVAIVEFTGRQP